MHSTLKKSPLALAIAAGVATAASAQTFTWSTLAGGAWSNPANWTPTGVPTANTQTAVLPSGNYTASLNVDVNLQRLELGGSGVTLNIDPGRVFGIDSGGILNHGLVLLDNADITPLDDVAFNGTGTVRLLSGSALFDPLASDSVVTNTADHTIIGRGLLSVPLINEGLIEGDDTSALTIASPTILNSGVIRASGILGINLFASDINQNAGSFRKGAATDGVIRADDSQFVFWPGQDSSITGGALISTGNSGFFDRQSGGTTTLTGVALDANLSVQPSATLQIEDGLLSQQTLTVNPDGLGSIARLSILNSLEISGSGEIVLNGAFANALIDSEPGATLTVASDHTIRGTGVIWASLVNNGLILADSSGGLLLQNGPSIPSNQPKINNGTIRAAEGILTIATTVIDQSGGGEIIADRGAVRIDSAGSGVKIIGGTLRDDEGTFIVSGGSTATLESVTIRGNHSVQQGTTLQVVGGSLTSEARLTVEGAATLDSVAIQGPIELDPDSMVQITGGSLTGGGAISMGERSLVTLDSVPVTGPIITGRSSSLQVTGGSLASPSGIDAGELSILTLDSTPVVGPILLRAGSRLQIVDGDLTGGGTIDAGRASQSGAGPAIIEFIESGSLAGAGQIVFNGGGPILESAPGAVVTIDPEYTVSGTGTINAEFINDGLVFAGPLKDLTLAGRDMTNRSVMEAFVDVNDVSNATLTLAGPNITQTAGSVLRANGPGTKIRAIDSGVTSITGESIDGINGGVFELEPGANVAVHDITLNTDTILRPGSDLLLDGNITSNGLININPDAADDDTFVTARADVLIDGTGRINLQGDRLDSRIGADNGFSLTLGENQALSGRGLVFGDFSTMGHVEIGLVPDTAQRTLIATNNFTLSETSTVAFDVYSRPIHDRFSVGLTLTVDGKLEATLRNGYLPTTPTSHSIITATSVSGRFDTLMVNAGDISPLVWRLGHRRTGIELWATCAADVTRDGTNPGDDAFGAPDGAVTVGDLSYFVEQWLANNSDVADVTTNNANPGDPGFGIPDGSIDVADLTFFVELWVAGCP
ncbi:MAG: GC-type dockerin domain-anchored protein [Planctomycetota bacterium]